MSTKKRKKPPTIKTLLSERISKARMSKGLTQAQLAHRLGIKKSTVNNWETERTAPRANRLPQLAGLLDVPLLWLIGGSDAPPEIDSRAMNETAGIEAKLARADQLVNELSVLLVELRAKTRHIQREFDTDA